ncbi:hypothetical protein HZ994_15375 [Akkermansiaceae bacterium]|nr:hypothetical protein HZ994_15375 [Akkermansiaceae bacterium]
MNGGLGSYSVSHFIPFTDEVYFRLFERQSEAWWPAHLLMLAMGAASIVLACLGTMRPLSVLLALTFAACGITFHLKLYAELTPVGTIFGRAFLLQAALIVIWGFATRSRDVFRPSVHAISGVVIAVSGIVLFPILSLLAGRGWAGAECFGMAPDPTVCLLLGIVLLCARPAWLLLLLPIPLLWAVTTGATLDALGAPFARCLPFIAAGSVVIAIWKAVLPRLRGSGAGGG